MLNQVLVAVALLAGAPPDQSQTHCLKVRIGGPVAGTKVSFDEFDHSLLDGLLCRFVDANGRVAYSQWQRDGAASEMLYLYLCSLATADSSLPHSQEAELAFFINAYNSLTIWGMLQEYPTVSIQQHNKKNAEYRVFDDLEVYVDGEYHSLNTIEHDRLRSLGDPRIHFALVCAAKSCPRLRAEAYVPQRLQEQLTDNSIHFFTSRQRFRICRLSRSFKVSPILKWYRDDFGESDAEVVAAIFPYLPPEAQEFAACHHDVSIKYLGYDWGLNDQQPPPRAKVVGLAYTAYAKLTPTIESVRGLFPRRSSDESSTDDTVAELPAPKPTEPQAIPQMPLPQGVAPPRALTATPPATTVDQPQAPRALHPEPELQGNLPTPPIARAITFAESQQALPSEQPDVPPPPRALFPRAAEASSAAPPAPRRLQTTGDGM